MISFDYAFATLLAIASTVLAAPAPEPQGVYDIIAPKEPIPPGCVKSFPRRFGLFPKPVHEGIPNGITKMFRDASTQLSVSLRNGILYDRQGRIGSIVANHQFQFDGPPAQAGAIYTAGWSVCPKEGLLALGNKMTFYRCKSGTFFNIYDETLGEHCDPVYLEIAIIA